MKRDDSFSTNQLLALCSLCFLVPALRIFPSSASELAGRASWTAALAALPLLLVYGYFLSRLMAGAGPGMGLGEYTLQLLGSRVGKGFLLLFALWYLLYGAFVLRSGAERLIATIYPYTRASSFIVSTGLLSLLAALCPARSLVRMAKLVLPAVLGFLLLILFYGLSGLDRYNLLPIDLWDLLPVLKASVSAVNVSVGVLYTSCFLQGMLKNERPAFSAYGLWLLYATAILSLLMLAICGSFGAELTEHLSHPFFSLVRSTVFFGSVERVEALVVSLWLFPDFLMVALCLYCAQRCLRLLLGLSPETEAARLLDLREGRWVIPLCGLVSMVVAVFLAPTPADMGLWSHRIIPGINLGFAFFLVPLIYIVGKLKKQL